MRPSQLKDGKSDIEYGALYRCRLGGAVMRGTGFCQHNLKLLLGHI